MKNFFQKLIMYLELIVGVIFIIWGFSGVLPTFTGNVILILIGFFLLIAGLGHVDKLNGYGQNNKHNPPPAPNDVTGDDKIKE